MNDERFALSIVAGFNSRHEGADKRNWPEDFSHENGMYENLCCLCKRSFLGHKRRVVCKSCATERQEEYDASQVAPIIRDVKLQDRAAWFEMALDYDDELGDQAVNAWRRMFEPNSGLSCQVVVYRGETIAFMQHVFHNFFFKKGQVCYLSDLYVRPEFRRQGIARKLLEYLLDKARTNKWARVYWITEHGNPAKALYDQYASPDFVRYHLDLEVGNDKRQI